MPTEDTRSTKSTRSTTPRGRTRTRVVKERAIETYLSQELRNIGALSMKFVSPENVGVPDRIVIHKGVHAFVELKRPGEKPDIHQVVQIDRMSRHGAKCFIASTEEGVDKFIHWLQNEVNNVVNTSS